MLSLSAEVLTVAVIRVEFELDQSLATTGDGSFVIEDTVDLECPEWTLDPPPHDKAYFQDHLIAADNYWQLVSDGQVSLDLLNSQVFPANATAAYQLPHDMLYYHPYLEDFDETGKLYELARDAVALADSDVDFNHYNTIIIVHAGMGGDFAFALDPTPGNIPSAYLTQSDLQEYGPLQADGLNLGNLIIIPESQNFLQYQETRSLFEDSGDPCFYQVGLNGTLALMLGFHLDLPPMYNTETGRSLVGGFALMDQGSNNFHGIVPAYPDPYTRILKGWATAVEKNIGDTVSVQVGADPVRVSIADNEYYLIENRQRNLFNPDTMILWIDSLGYDTVSVQLSAGGVVLQVDEQHAGLPGNGLNIWHVDESAWFTNANPNGGSVQLVDFVEADGAQDMGHTTQLLFAEYLETGWWFDPWFAGNEGWFHLNRTQAVVGDSLLSFNSSTFPPTESNTGLPSHLSIENISRNGSNMSFTIGSDRLVDTQGISSFVGWDDSLGTNLWAFNTDSSQINNFSINSDRLVFNSSSLIDPDSIFGVSGDSSFTYRLGLISPTTGSEVRFINLRTAYAINYPAIDSLFELSVNGNISTFYAKNGNDYIRVISIGPWGANTLDPLLGYPLKDFMGPNGYQMFYGSLDQLPMPVAIRHNQNQDIIAETIVLSWSVAKEAILVSQLIDGAETYISVEKPLHIIPMDTDDDGRFEIALFYSNTIKIINQAGVLWNGNPFNVESYFGNPIVAPTLDGELGIFLRHADHYTIHSPTGTLIDQGVLPQVSSKVNNSLRIGSEAIYILSNNDLLYFGYESLQSSSFWVDPQGSAKGDRVVTLTGELSQAPQAIKKGSIYNYPNPIKGSTTTIRAWIGEVDEWSIEIFSLNGAQVEYIELDVLQQNSYNEWVWDASAASNGVYLAQIVAGDRSEIIKIAIIR